MQLVDQDEQHVELADGAETRGDLPETPAELARHGAVELQHRQQLAQAPGGDAGLVQRAHVALLDGLEHACELSTRFLSNSERVVETGMI